MRQRNWLVLGAIAVLFVFALYVVVPGTPGLPFSVGGRDLTDLRLRQGLDLQGGLHVRMEADPAPGQEIRQGDMDAVRQVIQNRVNALGVAEPVIQVEGDRRLIVELPGVKDPDEAIRLFRETGELLIANTGFEFLEEGERFRPDPEAIVLTGRDFEDARVGFDELGTPHVEFDLKPEAGAKFGPYTSVHVREVLTITLDDIVVSSASINARIDDRGVISGQFGPDEARRIAIQLRYGALPVPLKVVQTLSVRPTLGQESLDTSVRAGIVGAVLVLAFMVAYYRMPGAVAAAALVIYAVLVFAIFKLVPVTLTLAGVAGFILSLGVAVDANILIFERTREEIRAGRTIRTAIEAGFNRAWPSIRDSNISTFIICAVLFGFGSGGVRGFALTLAIGVAVSMFSAITISRNLLRVTGTVPGATRAGLFGARPARKETSA